MESTVLRKENFLKKEQISIDSRNNLKASDVKIFIQSSSFQMKTLLFLLVITFSFHFINSNELKLSIHEHGNVLKDKITQFYLPSIPDLTDQNKLVITTFALSGDCHLYVSSQTNASSSQNQWKSTHTGPNFVEILKRDRNYHTGPYFVTVSGIWDTNFKVLAYITDSLFF
jgi:hypothetical protein